MQVFSRFIDATERASNKLSGCLEEISNNASGSSGAQRNGGRGSKAGFARGANSRTVLVGSASLGRRRGSSRISTAVSSIATQGPDLGLALLLRVRVLSVAVNAVGEDDSLANRVGQGLAIVLEGRRGVVGGADA